MRRAEAMTDPAERALAAHEPLTECEAAVMFLAAVRIDALLELRAAGWTYRHLAAHLGLSVGRVYNLMKPHLDREERS